MKNIVFQASLMMAFSVFCIMVTNACAKLASDYQTPIEIVFYRGLFCLVLSPICYTSLIWSVMFGWMFWDQLPTLPVIVGACLVVGSNMVIVWREAFHARAKNNSRIIEE